jgi:hypothetical protein
MTSPREPTAPGRTTAGGLIMSVLLISRGSMSGGEIVARELADSGGFHCLTREDLVQAVNRHGELASRVTAFIEGVTRHYLRFSELRRPYKILMRRALLDFAARHNVAYLGYSGHLLVPRIGHFAKARLEASLELRLRLTRERLEISEEEAREHIRLADEERVRWGRFMYGRDIRDITQYDLCITMDRLSTAAVVALLVQLVQQPDFQPTPGSLEALADLTLATEVEARLVLDPRLSQLEIGASAKRGHVALEGPWLDDPELAYVLDSVRAVPGVADVGYEPGCVAAPGFGQ